MAWSFGDSFDLYAAATPGDAINGYWDSGSVNISFGAGGRFAGSRCLNFGGSSAINAVLVKASGANDAVHHVVVAFQQASTITGSTLAGWFTLYDGATAQCSIVFRSDGAILLVSGASNSGTTLATYTGAFPVINTWYAFEIEVKIDGSAGTFAVRKNGNNVNDFSATSLNTRVSANNYANKLGIGTASVGATHILDDLFWQSGAATGAWLGDIRCYARMPASDQSVTFSRLSPFTQTVAAATGTSTYTSTQSAYVSFAAAYDGTVGAATVAFNSGFTGTLKCSVFSDAAGSPGAVLSSATTITNPVSGSNALTFPTPFTVVKGGIYWLGFAPSATAVFSVAGGLAGKWSSVVGSSTFPVASPTIAGTAAPVAGSITISPGTNYQLVNEAQQDALTSYVYDSNPGDADFYGIASIASTPATVIATTTRAYMQKSDAGTRTAAVQLKSGATTVASPTLVLTTSGWLWTWRTDIVDPNTSAPWTAAAVNNCTIGPKVIA